MGPDARLSPLTPINQSTLSAGTASLQDLGSAPNLAKMILNLFYFHGKC